MNGKLRQSKNASLAEKLELYILCDFKDTLREKGGGEGDIIQILEKQCKSTNQVGLAKLEEFRYIFMTSLSRQNQQVALQFFNPDQLFKKYFPKSFASFSGEERIGFRGMRNFFNNTYRL